MGWIEWLWAWLDINSKQLGAVSSIVFGLSSAVVAWVALRLNYRNNYGLKPLVLFLKRTDGAGSKEAWVGTDFEFWNRRRYPVVLRLVEVDFRGVVVRAPAENRMRESDKWGMLDGKKLLGQFNEVVDGNTHRSFNDVIAYVGEAVRVDAMEEPDTSISVTYFDPKKNRLEIVSGDSEKARKQWKKWRKERGIKDG